MKESIQSLLKNALFNNIDEDELNRILSFESCREEIYEKDSLVVQEGDYCNTIGFVLEGTLTIQQYGRSGDALTINIFRHGECFGAPLLFTKQAKYPFTLVTTSKSKNCNVLPICS